MTDALLQIALSLAYYAGLIAIMRLAGKRLAGQTTTFDLIVLISLGVVLQNLVLRKGTGNAVIFIVTVFAVHRGLAVVCARNARVRRLVRGAPRPLVLHGRVSHGALEDEGLSYDELLAGLRKLGYDTPQGIRIATLEETGHISAVAEEPAPTADPVTGSATSPAASPAASQAASPAASQGASQPAAFADRRSSA